MIDAGRLLADLKRLRADLEDDLRARCEAHPDLDAPFRAEHEQASGRTAQPYTVWRDARLTQIAAAWLLGCVFVRFLEDNGLVDPPRLSGPGERGRRALDEHTAWFRAHPIDTDREYLLHVFRETAALPAAAPLFHPDHNPVGALDPSDDAARRTLRPSGDAAARLLALWQDIDPDTGVLTHDFTDADWDTRFLGDLYQDLSDDARKRYALLQTPAFVEQFILDRTLTPAVETFGFRAVRLIDPACGSGHFLLGAFRRLDALRAAHEPGTGPRERARRVLAQIAGVDLNPFAVAVARFRLLVAALRAAEVRRLADAPAFDVEVAAGDALLHGPRPGVEGARKRYLEAVSDAPARSAETRGTPTGTGGPRGGNDDAAAGPSVAVGDRAAQGAPAPGDNVGGGPSDADAVFDDPLAHVYRTEDAAALRRILGRRYHAVVGNPPYITPKDPALNQAYRERFASCHRKYSLGAPFTERFFDLAAAPPPGAAEPAGFVGMITANSFMKREFGRKLIEGFLPRRDLTHVVDASGAYIPGHGTPTVILFGRNRPPVATTVRAVLGVRGEPSTPDDPARGLVWSAIAAQIDRPGSESAFVSVADVPRARFASHPWSLGGGGAAELKERLDAAPHLLRDFADDIGITAVTGADDLYVFPTPRSLKRLRIEEAIRWVTGDRIRDWSQEDADVAIWMYDDRNRLKTLDQLPETGRVLWRFKTRLSKRRRFGTPMLDRGFTWYEWQELYADKLQTCRTIAFAFVATHNHFMLDRGGKAFNRSAPVIKLPEDATEDDHLGLVGLLNSAVACFWMKQVFHNKGSSVDSRGARQRTAPFEDFYEHDGTKLKRFPVHAERPLALARALDALARERVALLPAALVARGVPTADGLRDARARADAIREWMIALQEELDWRCHRLYDVIDEDLCLSAGDGEGAVAARDHQRRPVPAGGASPSLPVAPGSRRDDGADAAASVGDAWPLAATPDLRNDQGVSSPVGDLRPVPAAPGPRGRDDADAAGSSVGAVGPVAVASAPRDQGVSSPVGDLRSAPAAPGPRDQGVFSPVGDLRPVPAAPGAPVPHRERSTSSPPGAPRPVAVAAGPRRDDGEDALALPAGVLPNIPDLPRVRLGERAFEIVLARRVAAGEAQTRWFERHGATPVTTVPDRWPAAYRDLVRRRIDAIERRPDLALIEQPVCKRRWNDEPWETQQERALRGWLLDRLEAPAHWAEPRLTTAAALADRMAGDDEFLSAAALLAGRIDFDMARLVTDLVEGDSVPLLPAVRFKPSGLRKRAAWEHTWDLQRREDALDARTALPPSDPRHLTPEQAAAAKAREVGAVPVPPRYAAADFRKPSWWRLRGKLDVPKERFFSLPGAERDQDPSLVIGWAGWDALARSRATAAWFIDRKERDGWPAPRLLPLLAALRELLPWVRQHHNAPDPDYGVGLGDYFAGFIDEEAHALGLSRDALRDWTPAETGRRRGRRKEGGGSGR